MGREEQQVFLLLLNLGLLSASILWCGYFAHQGLMKGTTFTPAGVRSGWLARISGVGYLVCAVLSIRVLPLIVNGLTELGWTQIFAFITIRFPVVVEPAFVFFGLGTLLVVFATWRLKKSDSKLTANQRSFAFRSSSSLGAVLFAISVCWVIGPPLWVVILIIWLFAFYMLMWPKQIMVAFSKPES